MVVQNVPTKPRGVSDEFNNTEEPDIQARDKMNRQMILANRSGVENHRRNLQLARGGSSLAKQARLGKSFQEENSKKISNSSVLLMMVVALIFDVTVGVVNFIGDIFGIGTLITDMILVPPITGVLWYMYRRKGIKMGDTKVIVRFWGTILLELIPVLSWLPAYALNVLLVTSVERVERATGISLPKK